MQYIEQKGETNQRSIESCYMKDRSFTLLPMMELRMSAATVLKIRKFRLVFDGFV